MNIHDYKNYYFIGAGGIGMSAIERYFNSQDKSVYGYDKTETELTKQLVSEGIDIVFVDDESQIPQGLTPGNTLVIFTPAIPKDSKIKHYFDTNGFRVLKRSEVLGEITKYTKCIGIAGTHGKTTTTTLLGYLVHYAKLPAVSFLGGISMNYDTNFLYNGNEISIVEADEFDRSFLRLHPNIATITSTDSDHLDIYGDGDSIRQSFNDYANFVPEDGFLIVKKGLPIDRKHLTYSAYEEADYYAKNIRVEEGKFVFDFVTPTGEMKDMQSFLPGKHNVENAVASLAIAMYLGVEEKILREGLESFQGIKRRFTRNIFTSGKVYIDDYAHHPTELDAALSAVRMLYPNKKLLTVFQPHLFTRTRDFVDGFAKSLTNTEELILLDIYPARELPIEGVASDWLLDKIELKDKEISSLSKAMDKIKQKDFDVILTVGAGDIDTLYKPIKDFLNEA